MSLLQNPIWQPYPELQVDWVEKTHGKFAIRTPWILVRGEVEVEHISEIEKAFTAINSKDQSPRAEMLRSYFLEQFDEYPLAHARPRPLEHYQDKTPQTLKTSISELERILCEIPILQRWDTDEILSLAQLTDQSDRFDAISLVTALRRLRLKASVANTSIQESLAELTAKKNSHTELFVQQMQSILEHSLYVTQNAGRVLKLGLGTYEMADSILQEFILSETGHDLLVQKSLKKLGNLRVDWTERLNKEVKSAMALLEFAARNSMASLAVMIESFEGVRYDSKPNNLWDLLDNIPGYPNASSGVREHERINDMQDHASVCIELAAVLPPLTRKEASVVIMLGEAAESNRQQLFQNLYKSTGWL